MSRPQDPVLLRPVSVRSTTEIDRNHLGSSDPERRLTGAPGEERKKGPTSSGAAKM